MLQAAAVAGVASVFAFWDPISVLILGGKKINQSRESPNIGFVKREVWGGDLEEEEVREDNEWHQQALGAS